MTVGTAYESTYRVLAAGSQGTAWAITSNHLISAGHVCSDDEGYQLPVVALQGTDGLRFSAKVIEARLDDFTKQDICLLETKLNLPAYVRLAKDMPASGVEAWYVGYPYGELIRSVGEYAGDTDGDERWNDYTVSAPCDPGASGSAVFTPDGVFGVLVRVRVDVDPLSVFGISIRNGEEGCVVSPLADIRSILALNGVTVH